MEEKKKNSRSTTMLTVQETGLKPVSTLTEKNVMSEVSKNMKYLKGTGLLVRQGSNKSGK